VVAALRLLVVPDLDGGGEEQDECGDDGGAGHDVQEQAAEHRPWMEPAAMVATKARLLRRTAKLPSRL
jgi:hypothetical protein